jgi:hypothetical protein
MLHSIECNAHLGSQFTVTMSPTMYAWPSLLLFNAASTKDLSEQPKTVKLSMFIDWVLEKVGNNQAIAIYDCKIYLSRKTTSRILLHVWRQSETNTLLPWRLPLQLCTYQQTNCYLVTLNTHMRKHIHTNTHTHTHTFAMLRATRYAYMYFPSLFSPYSFLFGMLSCCWICDDVAVTLQQTVIKTGWSWKRKAHVGPTTTMQPPLQVVIVMRVGHDRV